MRTMNRADVDRLQGKPTTPVKQPSIDRQLTAPAVDNTQLVAMQAAMATMAESMAQLPALLAAATQPKPVPKQMIATPERDHDGKLKRLVVDIIS